MKESLNCGVVREGSGAICGHGGKRGISEMRHDAGVRYFDVTPVMSVTGAGFVGLCYVALRAVFRQIVPNRVIKYQ